MLNKPSLHVSLKSSSISTRAIQVLQLGYVYLSSIFKKHRHKLTTHLQVIYNEGWGQLRDGVYPEFGLTELVRSIDPTRLIDSTTGWYDHGAGDFSVSFLSHDP